MGFLKTLGVISVALLLLWITGVLEQLGDSIVFHPERHKDENGDKT